MNPVEALLETILASFLRRRSPHLQKPGAMIDRQPDHIRRVLQELKSSDIDDSKVRKDFIEGSEEYYQRKEFEKIKLDFDKKLKR